MSDLIYPQSGNSGEKHRGTDLAPSRELLRENFLDRGAFAHLRKDWELGRWENLAAIDIHAYENERTFQSAALLLAVANQQLGKNDLVREYVGHALSAGASRALVIAVLASGVHNELGRARAVAGDHEASESQYRRAVEAGTEPGRREFAAAARSGEQAVQIGLRKERGPNPGAPKTALSHDTGQDVVSDPLQVYSNAPQILVEREAPPFVLLDSKSLPRSGLHYLRSVLQQRLGERFSFCEWYQEPGCCRSQPCRLTGFLDQEYKERGPSVRLVKSHDLELDDRIVPLSFSLRRLVLKRDPLYILTSWFALEQLSAHQACLESAGIRMEKILLQHEKAVLSMAYAVMDENFKPPTTDILDAWLETKIEYIRAFRKKWIESKEATASDYAYVVDYANLLDFVDRFLDDLGGWDDCRELNTDAREISSDNTEDFRTRTDPFSTPSNAVSNYIRGEADRFRRYAAAIY